MASRVHLPLVYGGKTDLVNPTRLDTPPFLRHGFSGQPSLIPYLHEGAVTPQMGSILNRLHRLG